MLACDRCHARKIKCDRRTPRCSVCEKAGAECYHTDRSQNRKIPHGYVQSLENKLQTLEKQNAELKQVEHHRRNTVTGSSSSAATAAAAAADAAEPALSLMRTHSQPLSHGGPATDAQSQLQHLSHDTTTSSASPESDAADAAHKTSSQTPGAGVPTTSSDSPTTSRSEHLERLRTVSHFERAYLGSSTNVDFVRVVESVIDANGLRQAPVPDPNQDADGQSPAIPTVPKDASLVARNKAQPLIDAYFAHWHITFPLIHRATFLKNVHHIYADKAFYEHNVFEAFAFDIILAMGSATRNRVDWSTFQTESHFARAMNKLDRVLRLPGIAPFQALILYCQYSVFSTLRDSSTDAWHLLGLAMRFCIEQNLHRHHGQRALIGAAGNGASADDTFEVEMARRCFWCFYNLDRVVSTTLGRPAALRDDEIDTPEPTRFDADCGESERWVQVGSVWTCPFLQTIELRRLSGRIHQCLYVNLRSRQLAMEKKLQMRDELQQELSRWKSDLDNLALTLSESSTTSSFLSRNWYEVIYNNAAVLLYRPSPMLPYLKDASEMADEEPTLQQLLHFSRCAITAYSGLLQHRKLNYSWITLYSVFMAGLSYVYAVGRIAKRKRGGLHTTLPTYQDVINETRLCSNVLVAICERWNDARGSCSIFDRLSEAAINEIILATFQTPIGLPGSRSPVLDPNSMDHRGQPELGRSRSLDAGPTGGVMGMAGNMQPNTNAAVYDPYAALDGFQTQFQELSNSLFQDGPFGSNEVVLGFDQEWFGTAVPR